jgi:hypothetical protein
MHRAHMLAWLLLAGGAPGSECRLTTGPDGLCAALRLDPSRVDLRIGSTLLIRVNGSQCTGTLDCVDCRRRFHWRTTAPDVVTVDSTGLIRAEHPGSAEIRLESDGSPSAILASSQVSVAP